MCLSRYIRIQLINIEYIESIQENSYSPNIALTKLFWWGHHNNNTAACSIDMDKMENMYFSTVITPWTERDQDKVMLQICHMIEIIPGFF